LFESRGLGANNSAISAAVIKFIFNDDRTASSGDPIGAITIGPFVRFPNTCAGRGAVKVTMAFARATAPVCSPITSASAPEGISTAITGVANELILAMASA
jgi:hypothetical protein